VKKGFKNYLKHLSAGLLLIVMMISSLINITNAPAVFYTLFPVSIVYFIIFSLGAYYRKGPLRNIGKDLLKDHENALEEVNCAKQPWK
jgi:hypothetical protein